jgi:CubicO group peptidase (beta-lactamase class C family)
MIFKSVILFSLLSQTVVLSCMLSLQEQQMRFNQITKAYFNLTQAIHTPGMAYSVITTNVSSGERNVMIKGFGNRNSSINTLDPQNQINEDTIFCIGSNTKFLSAYLAGIAGNYFCLSCDITTTSPIPTYLKTPSMNS